jgi:YegS/Rv2252/BmrU family lipid kinase
LAKITVIVNGASRTKTRYYQEILPALGAHHVTTLETTHAGHAHALARQHAPACQFLLAAGGDGTLNEVVNGTLAAAGPRPTLGVIPLGSGNDFARTLGATLNGPRYADLLQRQSTRPVDVGVIEYRDGTGETRKRFFINVCSVGMGPDVLRRIARKPRWLGARINYFVSILESFFSFAPLPLYARADAFQFAGNARVLALANGKSFGNQLTIAPGAKLDDGQLEIFLVGEATAWDFVRLQGQLKAGKMLRHPQVRYAACREIVLTSPTEAGVEADGEWIGFLPAKVAVATGRLKFIA